MVSAEDPEKTSTNNMDASVDHPDEKPSENKDSSADDVDQGGQASEST